MPEPNIIIDKCSGKDTDRVGYQYLKRQIIRRGDTLVIKELDRLSRSKSDIKRELEWFKEQGIRVKILDIPTTLTDFPPDQMWVMEMINSILIEVLGAIAENERNKIRSRQREGIDAAKRRTSDSDVLPHRSRTTGGRCLRRSGVGENDLLMRCGSWGCRGLLIIGCGINVGRSVSETH